jgi:hypothetical protein
VVTVTAVPAPTQAAGNNSKSWALGCVYLMGHCLSWSGWLVLQAPVLKRYPARLSVTSYTCFFGLLQFLAVAAVVERDAAAWTLTSGSELLTILYAVSWVRVRGDRRQHGMARIEGDLT